MKTKILNNNAFIHLIITENGMTEKQDKDITIYVDAIGGDEIEVRREISRSWLGLRRKYETKVQSIEERTVKATKRFLEAHPETKIILGGNREVLERMVEGISGITIVEGRATPYDGIRSIVKQREGTALNNGLEMLKDGRCNAVYTSGNTQAVAAYVSKVIECFEEIEIMPLVAKLPTRKKKKLPTEKDKPVYLIDVGGSNELDSKGLVGLALLAHAYCKAFGKIESPRIGLSSVGKEPGKGGPKISKTDEEIRKIRGINYFGLVEPEDWVGGEVDTVISEGFVGNTEIKLLGAYLKAIKGDINDFFTKNQVRKVLTGIILEPLIELLKEKYGPSGYNGAPLLVPGVFIKGHGTSEIDGIYKGLETALEHAKKEVPRKIQEELERIRGMNSN